MTSRMPELGKSGSVGALGEQSPKATRPQVTTYAKYPKVVLVTDCRTHLVLAAVPGRGPGSDLRQFKAALRQAAGRARIGTLLADADYDGEWVHEHVRKRHGIRTLIPPTRGRPSEKPPSGRWRRWMRSQWERFKAKYGQRWQVETVNSMIKRRLDSALRARSYWSQCREILLRVITHNVMIIICIRVFYRAETISKRVPYLHGCILIKPPSRSTPTPARQASMWYRSRSRASRHHWTGGMQSFS